MLRPTTIFGELRDILPKCYFTFQIVNDIGADQTARMRRLDCAFVVVIKKSQGFSCLCPNDVEAQASRLLRGYAPGPHKDFLCTNMKVYLYNYL